MATENRPVHSLQELCEIKLRDMILSSDTADEDFASLEPRIQMLIFHRLRTQYTDLHGKSKQLQRFSRSIPLVDFQLSSGSSPTASHTFGSDADRSAHRSKWHSISRSEQQESYRNDKSYKDFRSWEGHDLRAGLPETNFDVCPHGFMSPTCDCKLPRVSLYERISSQLLLYRLTAVFGMPPAEESDGYKTRWEVILRHQDGDSMLEYEEIKGSASVRFYGTDEAHDDALKLLNYLVGPPYVPTDNKGLAAIMDCVMLKSKMWQKLINRENRDVEDAMWLHHFGYFARARE